MLDLPGIIEGAKDGKGRGRQVVVVARTCSLIFIVLDVLKPLQHKKIIQRELEGFGIRLNKQPPNIGFRRKEKGGVNLQTLVIPFYSINEEQSFHVSFCFQGTAKRARFGHCQNYSVRVSNPQC